MKAYSQDLRERIVQAVEHGMTKSRAARTFATAGITPADVDVLEGYDSFTITALLHLDTALTAELRTTPDATLAELVTRWQAARGVSVSVATMGRAIQRLHWTRKKRRWVPSSATH